MMTVFVICMIAFVFKLAALAVKAAWGIARAIFCVATLPAVLIGIAVAGLIRLALPLLIVALVLAFLVPILRQE